MFDQPELPGAEDQARPLSRALRLVQAHRVRTPRSRGFMNRRAGRRRRGARALHGPPRLLHANGHYSSAQGLPRPERQDLQEGLQALPQDVPVRRRRSASGTRATTSRSRPPRSPSWPRSTSSPRAARAARCTLVAADVLDSATWSPGCSTFQRNAKGKAHDLRPAQLLGRQPQDARTARRALLRTVPGQVWLTETGGILKFLPQFPRNASRQANRTKYMFQLANRYDTNRRSGLRCEDHAALQLPVHRRARRAPASTPASTNPSGSKRKAYNTFKKYAARQPK